MMKRILAAILLLYASRALATDCAFNFRGSQFYVTDTAPEIWIAGSAAWNYPVGPTNGCTYGWARNDSTGFEDETNTNDRRLAGSAYRYNGAFGGAYQTWFQVDLPSGPGTYTITLALGSAIYGGNEYVTIWDMDTTPTLLYTVANGVSVASQHFLDANGTDFTNSAWINGNVAKSLTFASSAMQMRIGCASGTCTGYTHLAHLRVDAPGAAATATPTQTATVTHTPTITPTPTRTAIGPTCHMGSTPCDPGYNCIPQP